MSTIIVSKTLPNKPKLHFCQRALPPSQCFHFYPLPAKKQSPFSKRKRAGQTCSFYILFKNNNCSLNTLIKLRHYLEYLHRPFYFYFGNSLSQLDLKKRRIDNRLNRQRTIGPELSQMHDRDSIPRLRQFIHQ